MKVGVIKAGARIMNGGTSGGAGEAYKLCEMMQKGGAEVHIFTKILKKDPPAPQFHWHQVLEEAENVNTFGLDALVVINGSINFMGGAPDDTITLVLHMINNFKGPVFYLYCDPNLIMKQMWSLISAKNEIWKTKYNARTWEEKDINITRKDIFVICQSYNTDYVKEQFTKQKIDVRGVANYPFDKFPLLNKKQPILTDPMIDLSYGGTLRTGRREKKLIEFYWGLPDDISVEVFGKIVHEQFNPKKIAGLRPPQFTGAVAYDKMISKMSEALSHVVIGDDMYTKFDILSQRSYEAVLAGCATFIDSALDVNKRMYGSNKDLADFLYVDSRDQVVDRIRSLKAAGPDAGRVMADDILTHFNFDADEYCNGLVKLISKNI